MKLYMRGYRQLRKDQNRDEFIRKQFGFQVRNVAAPIPVVERPRPGETAAEQLEKLEPVSKPRREPMPLGERVSIARMTTHGPDPLEKKREETESPFVDRESVELDREVAEKVSRDIQAGFNARIEREKEKLKKALEEG